MAAPKCPLCGVNHWQREPHIWSDDPKPKKAPKPKPPVETPVKPAKPVETGVSSGVQGERLTQAEYNARWREKNPDKYREYMKEYMKAKRAKARESK